ncbi:hypothetical protein Droror1_Dr00012212 [Drosera rotundifolia]
MGVSEAATEGALKFGGRERRGRGGGGGCVRRDRGREEDGGEGEGAEVVTRRWPTSMIYSSSPSPPPVAAISPPVAAISPAELAQAQARPQIPSAV